MATQQELAAHLDLSDRQIRNLIAAGILERPDQRGSYDIETCRLAYIRHLRSVAQGHRTEDGGLDLVAERARLASAQADAQELKNAELRKELVRAVDVEKANVSIASAIAARMLQIPAALADRCAALTVPAEVFKLIMDAIRDALTELADAELVEDADADPDSEGDAADL